MSAENTQPKLADIPHLDEKEDISPASREIVLGVVGYAGSGCSQVVKKLEGLLETAGFECFIVKMSTLIGNQFPTDSVDKKAKSDTGEMRLKRATQFQNRGDELRRKFGGSAIASFAIDEIMKNRGDKEPGEEKIAFIVDSIKHEDEVRLLRTVYGESFNLIGVHCERTIREERLTGKKGETLHKFSGVPLQEVRAFLDRDEKDGTSEFGQHVRDTFCLSDYFLDNNTNGMPDLFHLNNDLDRLVGLITGAGMIRPTAIERAMYHAYAASLQSACLSRQVGASIVTPDGRVVATGANEAPKYKGGVYGQEDTPDHRCFAWEFALSNGTTFKGCHNTRKKHDLKLQIAKWFAEKTTDIVVNAALQSDGALFQKVDEKKKETAAQNVRKVLLENESIFEDVPGVNDLIEYSRSIHAEMNAILNSARSGFSTEGCTLLCTTFPCHNCARHLVAAGISKVFYIEPYTKSLAKELHSDSIATEIPKDWLDAPDKQDKMLVIPFSGAGPRMYKQHFVKRGEIKDKESGKYDPRPHGDPIKGVRLADLKRVEKKAADLTKQS